MQIKQEQREQQHDAVAGTMKRYKQRENKKKETAQIHLRVRDTACVVMLHVDTSCLYSHSDAARSHLLPVQLYCLHKSCQADLSIAALLLQAIKRCPTLGFSLLCLLHAVMHAELKQESVDLRQPLIGSE